MGKWVSAAVLDGALAVIAGADRMVAVAGQPADYAAAWNGRLAAAEVTPADFALQAGAGSGRRVAISGKTGVAVVTAGVADHVALLDSGASRLLYVTTCPAQPLAAGGTVSFDPWSVEIGSPQ